MPMVVVLVIIIKSDEELYQTLNTTVIPKYKEFNSRLEKVSIATSEVKDVHEKYISASNKQYQAFLKLQIAIEKQDKNLVLIQILSLIQQEKI
jgi:hypothetical protein